ETILDLNNPCLPAELLSPHPIGKHSDAWPQGGKAQLVEFHIDDFDFQHVTDFRPAYFNRSGRTVDERKSHVSLGQLLSEMADRAVVGVNRAFHHERFTGRDAGDEPVIARKRVFDVAHFADTLRHFRSLLIELPHDIHWIRRHGMRRRSILPTTKVSSSASAIVATKAAKTFGMMYSDPALKMAWPNPSDDDMNSPTMAPISAKPTVSFSPAKISVSEAGTTSLRKIWNFDAPSVRIRLIWSVSTPTAPL